MSSDQTQHQSDESQARARELSLEPNRPPADVSGYKLQRFIGRGTYGEVWSATNLKTGQRVAIKFYLRGNSADIQLLAQEVEKLVVLSADRYVVQLLDVGWDSEPPYYVMEYIEHGSLEDRLKKTQSVPAAEAVELFLEIATGMMHLHGKGILHCDLKPGNILLDQDGNPRVADFGQSRLKTESNSALGTLFYMAPEQADTMAIPDTGWDVYALGALLFSMLTGKPPYYSQQLSSSIESSEAIDERLEIYRKAIQSSALPTAHREIAGVDRMLGDIIDQCIAVDPKKRFTSIQSVLLALKQREMVKARRPIMLLGLLGPLMLIGLSSLFGWWAFSQAITKTNKAVEAKAEKTNVYAAQLAARSVAEQIDEYFRVVSRLANDDSFKDLFDVVMADEELATIRQKIANPKHNSKLILKNGLEVEVEIDETLRELRKQFRSNENRLSLQKPLETRLEDPDNEFPTAASWFVSDRFGNQVASVFPKNKENVTLANNFAYRTYFTGLDDDLELDDPPLFAEGNKEEISKRQIIKRPHLSAVFRSKQSTTWKIAFSAPIIQYGQVQGIVAVTVDLGSFVEFPDPEPAQYAMLVDSRPGDFEGTVLEHPLFQIVLKTLKAKNLDRRLPDELAQTRVDVSSTDRDTAFIDPVGQTQFGQTHQYGNPSIAYSFPILMEQADRILEFEGATTSSTEEDDNSREPTGLWIIAVQDSERVFSEVSSLGRELGRLAIFAALLLLAVAIGMWFFVNRMMQESRERMARAFSSSESSWLQDMETIANLDREKTTDFSADTIERAD